MLEEYKKEFEEDITGKETYTLEINITNMCNMRCSYCFEGEGLKKDTKVLNNNVPLLKERIWELLDSSFINNNYEGVTLDFWGGEPTLNMSLMGELINTFKYRPDMYFHVYSNGYSVDDLMDMAIEMKRGGYPSSMKIQFSYDGQPIHNLRRITKGGKLTAEKVIENGKILSKFGIGIDYKATIIPPDFKYLPQVWDDFKKLNDIFDYDIFYAPTIDYHNTYEDNHIEDLKWSMIEIAAKEVEFYKEHKRNLMKWFRNERNICGTGQSMSIVDTDGNVYFCHGCLYSKIKEETIVTSIFDDNFVKQIEDKSNFLKNYDFSHLNKECKECIANYCVKCNSRALEASKNETLEDRWFDFTCQPYMCDYFKLIGKIHTAMRKVIRGGE